MSSMSKSKAIGLNNIQQHQQHHQQHHQQKQKQVHLQPSRRFSVLYYKRSNKVHKNRGTTKEDGILTIDPPPSCLVKLVSSANDNNNDDCDNDNDNHNNNNNGNDDAENDVDSEEETTGAKKSKKQKWQAMKKQMTMGRGGTTIRGGGIGGNSSSSSALRRKSTNAIIWSGVNSSLSNKAHNEGEGLEEDNILILNAQWECEIVTVMHHSNSGDKLKLPAATTTTTTTTKITTKKKTALVSRKVAVSQQRAPLVPLRSSSTTGNKIGMNSTVAGGRGIGVKKRPLVLAPSLLSQKKPTLLSGSSLSSSSSSLGKMKKDTNGEWYLEKVESDDDDDDDDDDGSNSEDGVGGGVRPTTTRTSSIKPSLLRNPNSKRPRLMLSTRPSSLNNTSTTSTSTTTKTTTTTTISNHHSKNNSNNNNDFPGALGDKINVPPSVRDVLRPHQREGIAFLWNCVTGVSPGLNGAMGRALANGEVDSEEVEVVVDSEEEEEEENAKFASRSSLKNGIVPKGALLADEMGLGKTLMTIATIFSLHRRQKDRRFIVVCPSSLVSNWAKEFDKWLGKASQPKRVTVRNGNEEGLRNLRSFVPLKPNQSEVLILSYELLRLHIKILSKAARIGLLVVDEGHRLKNTAGSQTLSALNSLEAVEARILITGTPIQNNLSEFYTVANFAVPGILGDLAAFRRLYERPMSQANQKNASSAQKEKGRKQSKLLDDVTSTFVLRRLQKDVLKYLLPPRTEILLFCRPTERQCEIYRDISYRASRSIGSIGGADEGNNPLMLLTEVRKLCTHPSLLEKGNLLPSAQDASLSGKLLVLSSLLDSIRAHHPTDKVVIISNFTSALTVIEESILCKKKLPFVRLDGSTDLSSRQPLVDSFNNGSVGHSFVFLLSSKAGGCGLNLIGANRLIMVDADWNPATDQQAMARVYRQGQKKPCYIYRMFTTGTVEEVIFQRQTQKGNLAKLANDGGSRSKSKGKNAASFSSEELRDCFTLKEGVKCDTKRKLGKKWNDYNGASSLQAQGFMDGPLLDVCEDEAETLSFVRIVDDDEVAVSSACEDNEADSACAFSENDESFSEEEEFDG